MQYLSLLTKILRLVTRFLDWRKSEGLRQEGREQVKRKQHEQAERNKSDAQEIDDYVRGSDIDDLRYRMSDYKRPSK